MNSRAFSPNLTKGGLIAAAGVALVATTAPLDLASAGQVTVNNVNPGTNVTFKYTDPNDASKTITKTVPAVPVFSKTAVTVQLGLGSLADETKIDRVFITKTPFGGIPEDPYEVKLLPTGMTLASLEPFVIPTFAEHGVPLVAVVDIAALLKQGDPFTTGETITVSDGATLATSSIIFKDGSTLGPAPDLTDALIASLPSYSGSADVYGFDSIAAVPEPATWAMLTFGFAGLGLVVRRRARAPLPGV